jgi:hypothetical protein
MKKCSQCGKIVKNKYNNCPYCGTLIDKSNENNNGNKSIIIIISLTVILVLLVISKQLIFPENKTNASKDSEVVSEITPIITPIATPTEGLSLPNSLSKEQIKIMHTLQGKWKFSSKFYIFNNMQVQYYSNNNYGMTSYVMDLNFVKLNNIEYLVATNSNNTTYFKLIKNKSDGRVDKFQTGSFQDSKIEYSYEQYEKVDLSNIFIKDPEIGMTVNEVKNSTWGLPEDINRTTNAFGVSEQWVYNNYKYIYFEDGIVTSIQE